jgi:cytochrome c5
MSSTSTTARRSSLAETRLKLIMAISLALALSAAGQRAFGDTPERSGKDIVAATCSKCHATGVNGAPRIGDDKAWAKRASQGLASLTTHALRGIRKMPPHGTDFTLSDIEIQRAITYMVNQSGGHWTEPISKAALPAERTGEQVVAAQCHKCHEAGVNGAPKIGDRAAWTPRLKQGLDALVRSAINGHGGMPARGGMVNLTDTELRNAIVYMFSKGTAAPQKNGAPQAKNS